MLDRFSSRSSSFVKTFTPSQRNELRLVLSDEHALAELRRELGLPDDRPRGEIIKARLAELAAL